MTTLTALHESQRSALAEAASEAAALHAALCCAVAAQGFIKKYVQCYSCGNPETVVKVRKENIFAQVQGVRRGVRRRHARHKLNTYILKNPPEEKVSKAEKKCARGVPGPSPSPFHARLGGALPDAHDVA